MANGRIVIEAVLDDTQLKNGLSGFSGMGGNKFGQKGIQSMTSGTKGLTKSFLGAQLAATAITKGLSMITSGAGAMVDELNSSNLAWQTFEGNMRMIGKSESEIAKVTGSLQKFAQDTIYSSSEMASTYAQMTAIGAENAEQLVKGLGGIASSSDEPASAMKRLSLQMVQALSKPTMKWEDFRFMLEAAPAGMAQVAEHMGMSLEELVVAIQNGEISSEKFADAVAKVGTNEHFTELATKYKSTGQAIDGLTETIANKLRPMWQKVDGLGIKTIEKLIDWIDKIDMKPLEKLFDGMINFYQGMKDHAFNMMKTLWSYKDTVLEFSKMLYDTFVYGKKRILDFLDPMIKGWRDINKHVSTFVGSLGGVFKRLRQGDWKGAWNMLRIHSLISFDMIKTSWNHAISSMKDNIFELANVSSWNELGETIADNLTTFFRNGKAKVINIGQTVRDWVFKSVGATSWEGVSKIVLDKIADGFEKGLTATINFGSKLKDWLFKTLEIQSFGELGALINTKIMDAMWSRVEILGGVVSFLQNWLFDRIGAESWSDVGLLIGEKIAEAIRFLPEYATDFSNYMQNWLLEKFNAVDFDHIGFKFGKLVQNGLKIGFDLIVGFFRMDQTIGQALWDMFVNIDWYGITFKTVQLAVGVVKGLFDGMGRAISQFFGDGSLKDKLWNAISHIFDEDTGVMAKIDQLDDVIIQALKGAIDGLLKSVTGLTMDEIKQELVSKFESLKDIAVEITFEGVLDSIKTAVSSLASSALEYIDEKLGGIPSKINEIIQSITNPLGNGLKSGAGAFGGAGAPGRGGKGGSSGGGSIQSPFANIDFTGDINRLVTQMAVGSAQIQAQNMNMFNGLNTTAQTGWSGLLTTFGLGGQNTVASANNTTTGVLTASQGVLGASTFFNTMTNEAVNSMLGLATGANSHAQSAKEGVTQNASSMNATTLAQFMLMNSSTVAQMVMMAAATLIQATAIKNAVVNTMKSMQTNVIATVNAMSSGIVSALQRASYGARSAGYNTGMGFYGGLASTAGSIYALASSIASNVAATMRRALSIHSPSRVLAEIGRFTGQGFAVGMEGEIGNIERTARLMAESSIPKLATVNPNVGMGLTGAYGISNVSTTINRNASLNIGTFVNNDNETDVKRLMRQMSWIEEQAELGGM